MDKVKKLFIWGNHSSTMYPDVTYCTVDGKKANDLVSDDWLNNDFVPTI